MISTILNELVIENGVTCIMRKELPNWYGIQDVGFIWHGEWAAPEVEYNGKTVNAIEVGESLWNDFYEEFGRSPTDEEFDEYMIEHQDMVKFLIEEIFAREKM